MRLLCHFIATRERWRVQDNKDPNKNIRVLAVDDEEDARKLINAILGNSYVLELAANASEALVKIKEFKPDLVLSDLKMPGEDGMTLLANIKSYDPTISVVIMTGYADKAVAIQAIKKGAFDFLEKPFSPDELRMTVARAADKIAMSRSLRAAEIKAYDNARLAALGEMAAGVAHEVNNPVTIIQGYARVLKKMAKTKTLALDKVEEISEIIDRTSVRISKIITSLRKLARPDTQDFNDISVKEIIDDTLGLCAERFKNSGVDVRSGELPLNLTLFCNQLQLSQVLLNLMNNAYQAVSKQEGSWIELSVKDLPDSVQIRVTDSGSGIPEELREKIFKVFFTTKEVGVGTGLGLSLSRQMIENHKGTLDLDVECPNTSFVITIPKQRVAA